MQSFFKSFICGCLAAVLLLGSVMADEPMSDPAVASRFSPGLLQGEIDAPSPPSPGKAFFLSLLVPGVGEYYARSKKMAGVFFGLEVAFWTTYFSFRAYGAWKKSDYQQFAAAHAGVSTAGKDYDYYIAVEDYMTLREYNEAKLQQRNTRDLYPETDAYNWAWDSEASRTKYEDLRIASDRAYRGSLFVVGGIVLNHIVSGIDAIRVARGHRLDPDRVRLGFAGMPEGGMQVVLVKPF